MKALRTLILPVAAGLLLMSGGCGSFEPDLPDPIGAAGFISVGWDKYAEADFDSAMVYFQDAIYADVTNPGGYLGAGWTSIQLDNYWVIADNYFYMALQLDGGKCPVLQHSEVLAQDTLWTVFQCIDPDLPPEVLDPILASTADSGGAWVGATIYDIVSGDGETDIPYKFQLDGDAVSMLYADNAYSLMRCFVDSLVYDEGTASTWVFLTAPAESVIVPGPDVWTWINVNNTVQFDFATFEPSSMTQISYDALAGWGLLEDARGTSGNKVNGAACMWVLSKAADGYAFGAGDADREGLVQLNDVRVKGVAAALAFGEQAFPFAWFTCKSEGYGLGLDPTRASFIPELMAIIETMLNFV